MSLRSYSDQLAAEDDALLRLALRAVEEFARLCGSLCAPVERRRAA